MVEENLEPTRTSKKELFANIVNGLQRLTIFATSSILNVRLSSEYTSTMIPRYRFQISVSLKEINILHFYTKPKLTDRRKCLRIARKDC